MSGERAVRLRIAGRVQGVGFRWFLVGAAREHGVRGCVRNLDDGRVEAVAAGSPEAVERFVAAAGRGPRGAQVAGLEVEDAAPPPGSGFEIVR